VQVYAAVRQLTRPQCSVGCLHGPDRQCIGVVVHCRKPRDIIELLTDGHSERAAIVRIYRNFFYECPVSCELDDLAGLVGVGVESITIGYQQVPVGSDSQVEGTMQVDCILVDQSSSAFVSIRVFRVVQYIDRIIRRRCQI
jgi:hypothetical protein